MADEDVATFSDRSPRFDAYIAMDSGHVLTVRNVGLGPALDVIAETRVTYFGYAICRGQSHPLHVPVGEEEKLYIVQDQAYVPGGSTNWSVRVTYSDAGGNPYWIALEFGRRSLMDMEEGEGPLPYRRRLSSHVAQWDAGPPTITFGFKRRQQLRFEMVLGELIDWYRMPARDAALVRSWKRARTLPAALWRACRVMPDEYRNDVRIERGPRKIFRRVRGCLRWRGPEG